MQVVASGTDFVSAQISYRPVLSKWHLGKENATFNVQEDLWDPLTETELAIDFHPLLNDIFFRAYISWIFWY
jgi:hypothetical protein